MLPRQRTLQRVAFGFRAGDRPLFIQRGDDATAASRTEQQVASPLRLSETPVQYRNAPPLLGEHTEQVLTCHLGLSAEQIAALREAGVL